MKNSEHDQECAECDLVADERLNYFTGQFLTERDFRAEQEYQIGKHRQHNRYLHGYGTVCGLKIVQHPNPDCQDRFVILEPGLALDCCGREIVVKEKVYIDLIKLFAAQNIDLNSIDPNKKNHLLFSLCYEECKTEFVPALYAECGCDEFGCDANRIVEGFEVHLQLLKDLPKPLHEEPDGVSLDWITTLSLDKAFRVVLDSKGARIYVLTAANPGQILVYEATHHCLLGTIPLLGGKPGAPEGIGVDLAIAPKGDFLYVLRYVETTPTPSSFGNYFLQVIQVKNPAGNYLSPAIRIETNGSSGDLPLNPSPISSAKPPQIFVSHKESSDNVYTLDLNAKKITIWNAQIITKANADPTIAVGILNSPKSYEVATGNDPRSIAVSPNDNWVLLAEAGTDNVIKVFKVGVSSLVTPPSSISTADPPILLAVSGDSLRLYAITNPATGSKKVHAFSLEESPQRFPKIKPPGAATFSGIDIGAEIPVAIAVSPSGKWAYILLKGKENQGIIKVVDVDKIATDPSKALSPSVFSVISDPQDLVLDPEGNRLYVTGKGSSSPPTCGGVSVIDVKETQCSELIWRALDGCPECPEVNCVPLAIVEKYVENYKKQDAAITTARIENRKFRPLVTSTETLKQLVMCALETGGGTKGKEGSQGLQGEPGKDGKPGLGLIPDLPKIVDISWTHRGTISWSKFADNFALRVYFDREMTGIDLQTFKVWIDYPGFLITQKENILNVAFTGLYNITNLRNDLTSTSFESIRTVALDLFGSIKPALQTGTTPTPRREPYKWVVDFNINQGNLNFPRLDLIKAILTPSWIASKQNDNIDFLPCVHIMLKGDFIRTPDPFKENGVLDADNIGGQVGPNRNSGNSTQGGYFESWFFLEPPKDISSEDNRLGEFIGNLSNQ